VRESESVCVCVCSAAELEEEAAVLCVSVGAGAALPSRGASEEVIDGDRGGGQEAGTVGRGNHFLRLTAGQVR
jgi:hypothetical protein